MIVCKFKICGNGISVIDLPIVAADNIQTLFVKFAFSADWDGYVKYAVFFRRNGTPIRQVLDSDGSCAIPAEILSESGGFNVGVYGESDTARINSALAYIKPVEGAYRQAEFPGENPYDPSIWTQLWEAIGEKQDVIADLDTIRENAEAGAELAPYVEDLQTDLSSLEARVSNAEDDIEDIKADVATLDQEKYQKPTTGIPKSDLASAVQTSLTKADEAYKKPNSGIPKYDLATQVQASLDKADVAVEALATKQDKLTAGQNITIVGNVISAENDDTTDHRQLTNRDANDAHPIKAITGLQGDLASLSSRITSNANAILLEGQERASADDTFQANINELDVALAQEVEARVTADNGKVDKVEGKGLSDENFTSREKRTLYNIAELLKGHEYTVESGTSPSYAQIVQSGAQRWAELGMIGGASVRDNSDVVHGKCDKVITRRADDTVIAEYAIPDEIQAMDGYGWGIENSYNYVDFAEKKYHKSVVRYEFKGTENWVLIDIGSKNTKYFIYVVGEAGVLKEHECISNLYENARMTGGSTEVGVDVLYTSTGTQTRIAVRPEGVANMSLTQFKNSLNEAHLIVYVVNSTEDVIDVSDYLLDDNIFLDTEVGGAVVFHQQGDTSLLLPNNVSYMTRTVDAI